MTFFIKSGSSVGKRWIRVSERSNASIWNLAGIGTVIEARRPMAPKL